MAPSPVLAVPFWAAALALAISGLSKLNRPGPLVRMLAAADLPASPGAVRSLAAGELVLGSVALMAPSRWAALTLATAYLCFAAFLWAVLAWRIEVPSCGCAGERDLPPSPLHVGLDLVAGASGIVAAATGPSFGGVPSAMRTMPLAGLPLVAGVVLIVWLAFLFAAYLPGLMTAYGRQT
ncbi:MAG: hypothetical protein E6G44_02755 [Actinobacteria bacterium]|nr:MAG: hypothetical protein E6G44_02755 [Actinomycetota bacterium]